MAIPGTLSGIGQGIAASDPRQPYRGFGVGMAAGIQPMQKFSGALIDREMANEQYEGDTARMLARRKALREDEEAGSEERFDAETGRMIRRREAIRTEEESGAEQRFDVETERMIRRGSALKKAERASQSEEILLNRRMEQEQARLDAERFKKFNSDASGIRLGMSGLDDRSKMFAAQFAASQILPSPAMRMAGIQSARNILGGR
jgi:hypothetical protein